ncbi:hypothetical protein WY02_03730 [Pseudonocardia sp. AL041005-10]|nr:hypothetical protein WY02_03730 [Pseudonocardia sp. AL041005-10]
MTWFKVDDGFDDDPRMFDAPDCAVSLWTRAGAWASRHLTDGFIPAALPERKCEDPERAIAELVARGVWEPAEGGWRYVAWTDDQPSREEVLEKRRKETQRKARMRAALAEKRRKARSACPAGTPGGTPAGTPGGNPTRSPALPDPGSLPSSGTPAADAGGGAPAAAPAEHVPSSSAETRARAREIAGLRPPPRRRGRHVSAQDRPLMASVRDPRAEQDRLAELDAVQAVEPPPGGLPAPGSTVDSASDQQKRATG